MRIPGSLRLAICLHGWIEWEQRHWPCLRNWHSRAVVCSWRNQCEEITRSVGDSTSNLGPALDVRSMRESVGSRLTWTLSPAHFRFAVTAECDFLDRGD